MNLLVTYVFLIFGISASLYFFGFTSPLLLGLEAVTSGGEIGTTLLDSFINIFFNPIFLSIIGVTAVASYLTSGAGNSITYVIPIFMLLLILNLFILPTSYILSAEMTPIIKLFVSGFLNLLLGLAITEFIRGSG